MRAYVMITGAVFGLIALAHLLRMILEGRHVATDPIFILLTIVAGSLCFWAWRLVRSSSRS